VEPTNEELAEFTKFMESTPLPTTANMPALPKLPESDKKKVDRDLAHHVVSQWKRNKALYEEYGGIVLFQQMNPMEAFGAMRKLLEIHQTRGDFQIYDDALRREFWAYYLKDPVSWKVQKPEDIDYSKPWWREPRSLKTRPFRHRASENQFHRPASESDCQSPCGS
jgi:hypothetical protein